MYDFLKGRLVLIRLVLLASVLALIGVGILSIYSVGNPAESGASPGTGELDDFWGKQINFFVIGAVFFVAVNLINYRRFGSISYWLYAGTLVFLVVLLVDRFVDLGFVPVINGSRRWLRFQIMGKELPAIQPSEFCKLAYILALAWYLRYRSNYSRFRALIGPFVLTLVPMILILLEPDLGTVLLMMPILFVMLFVAGAKLKHLLLIVLLAVLFSPLLWRQMNPYQRIRISSVLLQSNWLQDKAQKHPKLGQILVGKNFSREQWMKDWGYHLIRSKYAVASGGTKGYGFRRGPFVKYNFLFARHNDFVFAVIAHQWGFLGCIGLLGLYTIIIGCGLEIAGHNTDPFGRLVAVGIVTMFAVEVIVNVSMTLGLMPITGLTLPFVSYGGSSLLVSMTSVGFLNNIGRRRPFSVARKA
jgi:rod shape determining protein RodA